MIPLWLWFVITFAVGVLVGATLAHFNQE